MPAPDKAAADIRVATFNAENLFARYRFAHNFVPTTDGGFTVNNLAFDLLDGEAKRITGAVVRMLDADVLCLQEVENLEVLERFNSKRLAALKYRHRIVIDSQDPRKIDVAVLSKFPISQIRTNRHLRNAANTATLFSRDCLEVTVEVPDPAGNAEPKPLALLVNHLKSMMGGRADTRDRRVEQAAQVVDILGDRFGDGVEGNVAVLGDLNDFVVDDQGNPDPGTGIDSLVNHPRLVNVFERANPSRRGTHTSTSARTPTANSTTSC